MNAESDQRRELARVATTGATAGGATASGATGVSGREQPALGSRAPRFIQASRTLHLSWQVGVFLVGLAIVVGGVILLPLPGPGWLVIFAGLAVWATEFVWAQLVLRWTKRKVTEAAQKALDPRVRRRNAILTAIALAIIAAAAALYVNAYGFVLPWNIDR